MERKIMKKFLIALCGILVVGNANAYHVVSDSMSSNWLVDSNSKLTFDLDTRHIIIAKNIYDNGGRFCFLSADREAVLGCATFCKENYAGVLCADQIAPDQEFTCDDKTIDARFSGDQSGTDTTWAEDVFDYSTLTPTSEMIAVLGVIERKPHAIKVAPLLIKTNDWSAMIKGTPQWLCPQGYVLNEARDDCVRPTRCDKPVEICPGETDSGFVATQHEWLTRPDETKPYITKKVGNKMIYSRPRCRYFRCPDQTGFKSTNDKTCVECEGGALAYIKSDGTCGVCKKGEIATESRNGCEPEGRLTKYSQSSMKKNGERECWMETDAQKFLGCVKGCAKNECWRKNNGCNQNYCD